MDVKDIVVRELHQMNIYLKSIAESLANRKVILKTKPENRKKLEEQIANSSGGGMLFVDDCVEIIKESKTWHCNSCKWYDEDGIYNPNCENCCRNYKDNYKEKDGSEET